jgi:hypothetical protein
LAELRIVLLECEVIERDKFRRAATVCWARQDADLKEERRERIEKKPKGRPLVGKQSEGMQVSVLARTRERERERERTRTSVNEKNGRLFVWQQTKLIAKRENRRNSESIKRNWPLFVF